MKQKFLWGSATASYQCEGAWNEGGRGITQWDVFSHESDRNINNVTGDIASDFYHRYEEDIRMLAEGGQNTYRFSIAWTRILPKGYGEINQDGVDFYNNVIDTCIKYGVEPNVTLHHYDLPIEFAENGGWVNPDIIDYFTDYSRICFELFGDRVKLWVTHNELRYYAHCCYLAGNYPPHHELDFNTYAKVMYNAIVASARAVIEYRKMNLDGQIGIVHPSGSIESKNNTEADIEARKFAELYYIRSILDPAVKGEIPQALIDKVISSGIDLSFMKEEDKETIKNGTVDFIGLNLYTRHLVKPYTSGDSNVSFNNKGKDSTALESTIVKGWFETDDDPYAEKNMWGREVYPKAMYDGVKYIDMLYPGVPIYVTENGHAIYDELIDGQVNDFERIRIVRPFVEWLVKAREDGVNLCGYYMWSTMDLYSWVNGYKKRYGLVYVDFENNCKRIPKMSYYWYKEFIENDLKGDN